MRLIVKRQRKTTNGILGIMTIEKHKFHCFTIENLDKAIKEGEYPVTFTWSKRFQKVMPLIDVPGREGIRIHVANFPIQLSGCIAVGSVQDDNAVYNSTETFDRLFKIIKDRKDVKITISWDEGDKNA